MESPSSGDYIRKIIATMGYTSPERLDTILQGFVTKKDLENYTSSFETAIAKSIALSEAKMDQKLRDSFSIFRASLYEVVGGHVSDVMLKNPGLRVVLDKYTSSLQDERVSFSNILKENKLRVLRESQKELDAMKHTIISETLSTSPGSTFMQEVQSRLHTPTQVYGIALVLGLVGGVVGGCLAKKLK